ncbi:MAG: phosphatase PAP2 family protein [Planctomycetota bacterium]
METQEPPSLKRQTPDDARRRWSVSALLICNLGAVLLLGSWIYAPTRSLWDGLDRSVFGVLNGSLDGPRWWQITVAVTNNRKFDLVPFILTVILLWCFVTEGRRSRFVRRSAATVMILLVILAVRKFADMDVFQIDRESPTRVIDSAIRVSEQVTWIAAKDGSKKSFPGDHSMCLMMLNVFLWFYGGRRWGILYAVMAVAFSLPRMIAGAHWLTDNLVGGGFIALLSMSWLLSTPLKGWLLGWFEPVSRKLLGRFQPA